MWGMPRKQLLCAAGGSSVGLPAPALPPLCAIAEMRLEPWQTEGLAEPVVEAKLPRERK